MGALPRKTSRGSEERYAGWHDANSWCRTPSFVLGAHPAPATQGSRSFKPATETDRLTNTPTYPLIYEINWNELISIQIDSACHKWENIAWINYTILRLCLVSMGRWRWKGIEVRTQVAITWESKPYLIWILKNNGYIIKE